MLETWQHAGWKHLGKFVTCRQTIAPLANSLKSLSLALRQSGKTKSFEASQPFHGLKSLVKCQSSVLSVVCCSKGLALPCVLLTPGVLHFAHLETFVTFTAGCIQFGCRRSTWTKPSDNMSVSNCCRWSAWRRVQSLLVMVVSGGTIYWK